MRKKLVTLGIIVGLIATTLFIAHAKYESESKDAASVVLYGNTGTAIVPIKVAADGTVETNAAGIFAPSNATYITQTANASLTAEQALSTLSSGIMRVATTTGVITSLTDSAGVAANISDETGTGVLVFNNSPTFADDIQLGLAGASGTLKIFSEQGATDYTASLLSNTAMTSDASFYLPVDEPGSTLPLTMTSGGIMGFNDQAVAIGSSVTFANVTDSALTSGRVVIGGASGLLGDDIDLTFTGSTLTIGSNGSDGGLTLYSEEGGTDYTVSLYPNNIAMTSNANFYLPADEPAAQSLASISTGGVIGYVSDSNGLAANLSDETGTGVAVFNNSPSFTDDITIGTNGPGGSAGTITLRDGANPGTSTNWTYTLATYVDQDVTNDANPSFNTINVVGTNSLNLGTASTNLGQIVLKNNTNANTLTLQPGATGANISFTLPTALPALSGAAMVSSDAGVLSLTSDPAFSTLNLVGTNSFNIGTGSSATGQIVFKNATNNNTVTMQSGVTSASYTAYLPTAAPAATYLLNMTSGGVMGYDTNTYLTAEVDGIIGNEITNVTGTTLSRSGTGTGGDPYLVALNLGNANSWTAQQDFQNATSVVLGQDVGAGTPNVAGVMKMFSAGDNAYYSTFTAATQTASATYTLPTAPPTANGQSLTSTTAGVWSWTSIPPVASTRGTFVNGDLAAGVLTITHNYALSAPYVVNVVIFNNSGKKIVPDDITGSANSVAVDLTSYGTLTGTWGYSYN